MSINWVALSAIGTISSSFVAMIAVLLTMQQNRREKRMLMPRLKVSYYSPRSGTGRNSGSIYISVSNISHFSIKISCISIDYFCPHKADYKLSRKTRFQSKMSSIFPFIKSGYKLSANSFDHPKLLNMCRYSLGNSYTKADGTTSPNYTQGLPEEIPEYYYLTIAICTKWLLSFMEPEISKNKQKFSICITDISGRSFSTHPISIRKLKKCDY